MTNIVDPVAVNRAVASLNELAERYGRAYAQLDAGAVQELHVLRLSYDALGVVLGVRTPNERVDVAGAFGTTPACDCEDQAQLLYDTCPSGVHRP